jgi:transcriptional regulator with XRE-family HTH domain
MIVGERVRRIREQKNISQGQLARRAGVVPYHLSRIENGHTSPSVGTLEKLARALEIPVYQLFYEEEASVKILIPADMIQSATQEVKAVKEDSKFWEKLRGELSRMKEWDRNLLLSLAQRMALRKKA